MLRPEIPLLASLVLLYGGVGLALGLPRQAPGWHVLWLVLVAILLLPFAVVARGFGRVDMMAFLFHAQLGIDGGSVLTLKDEITASLVAKIVFLVGAWYLLSVVKPFGRAARIALPAAVAVLVGINPMSAHVLRTVLFPPPDLQLGQKLVTPVPTARPDPLPDFVHLYLEGLDRRFVDPALGGDSYDPLLRLASEGLSLTNIGQITGTGWSLGGMVASQCGVPVLPRGLLDLKNLQAVTTFMPGLTCLGDILDGHGYRSEFIVGGDEDFAGISAFYASHGADEIWGKLRQVGLHPRADVLAADLGWILDDQLVYDTARQRFGVLAGANAPFALFIETSGPHGKTGSLSRSCTADGKAVDSRDHARTVRCLGDLTLQFVRDIRAAHKASGRLNPLRIVVQSDHLYHARSEIPARDELERNTVILLGGPETGGEIATPGSMIDVYPTVLDWLGFDVQMAGLGRSLLSGGSEPTPVASYGLEQLSEALLGATDLVDLLWGGSG